MYVSCTLLRPPAVKSLAVIIFSTCIFLDWSATKTLTSPLIPSRFTLLIMIIVWTSVEFRCETFAFLSRIKHAMSWPFVCRDFHSTSVQRSLQAPRKHSFSLKNIIQMFFSGSCQVAVFLLYFGSVLFIFSLVCLELWPCSEVRQIITNH